MRGLLRVALGTGAMVTLLLWAGDGGMATGRAGAGRLRFPGVAAESCGAGKDLVVQALERLRANAAGEQLVDANELLKRAADLCSESGEAWYYRSLVEAKMGHAAVAEFAMKKARMFPSEALTDGLNPFVLATPPPGQAAPLGPVQERWAVVIGIGSFTDPSLQPLQYSAADAEAFRDVLLDPKRGGFKPAHVKLLTDDKATLRGIKEALNWMARSAKADDLAVVYVASHGSSRHEDTAEANYIMTHDTEVGKGEESDTLFSTALPMVELSNDVATRLKAQRTAIFIDTCYSGGAETGAETKPSRLIAPGVATAGVSTATLEQMGQGSGRMIFAAAKTDEESLESGDLKHGYFTYYLVQTLSQHPAMPLTEVFAAVQAEVSAKVKKDYEASGLRQTPVMSRSGSETDFSLGVKSGVAVARLEAR